MERLLQINIIGIHRRVLSPTKRPARRGFYIFSTLHLLLLLPPLPTLLPIFFVSPPPPLPLAASHQRRTSIAPSPPPPPPLPPRSRDSHTRCTRALIFIIRVFWNFSSGAQHCFTVCHCYTPTSCQARERRGLSRTGIRRTLQRQTPILLPYPPPLPPALPPPPPPTLQPSPISHPDPHPPPPSPLYPCSTPFLSTFLFSVTVLVPPLYTFRSLCLVLPPSYPTVQLTHTVYPVPCNPCVTDTAVLALLLFSGIARSR